MSIPHKIYLCLLRDIILTEKFQVIHTDNIDFKKCHIKNM